MEQSNKNYNKIIRLISLALLILGLFLPVISIKFLGISQGISLFDIISNISSLSFLGKMDNLITAVYAIFFIYLISIITGGIALFNNSKIYVIISGIFALVYSAIIFAGVQAVKSELASAGNNPLSRAIGSAVSTMFNVDIGVGVVVLAGILQFISLKMK